MLYSHSCVFGLPQCVSRGSVGCPDWTKRTLSLSLSLSRHYILPFSFVVFSMCFFLLRARHKLDIFISQLSPFIYLFYLPPRFLVRAPLHLVFPPTSPGIDKPNRGSSRITAESRRSRRSAAVRGWGRLRRRGRARRVHGTTTSQGRGRVGARSRRRRAPRGPGTDSRPAPLQLRGKKKSNPRSCEVKRTAEIFAFVVFQ